jgi:hypothetical protein
VVDLLKRALRTLLMTESAYEGRSIKLRSGQQEDGTWGCEYTIIESGSTGLTHITGYPKGSFSTRDEAEAAALETAQAEIDAGGLVGQPINGSDLV